MIAQKKTKIKFDYCIKISIFVTNLEIFRNIVELFF